MSSTIRTRFLILSDTHGISFSSAGMPTQQADVVIHCGDFTDGSSLTEFRAMIQLLKNLNAPVKLVIAGNHDFALDIPAYNRRVAEVDSPLAPELVAKEYGRPGEAGRLFENATHDGIVFLDEGTHHFMLKNGALLTVFASPQTPALGAWGFQYNPDHGHNFAIEHGVDVVITHGPPKGILDYTHDRERAGCADLFAANARARPRVHCFGHIHEGWGGKLVSWRDTGKETPNHFTAIDNERSHVIERLATLTSSGLDSVEDAERRLKKREGYSREKCCRTSHCAGDKQPLVQGIQTLFVYAATANGGELSQKPWLVDIELPTAHHISE